MRKALLLMISIVFLFMSLARAGSEELTLKQAGKGEWKILNSTGQQVGTLAEAEEGAFSVQINGQFMGFILKGGELKKPQRRPLIPPSEAQFYLDTLEAIKKMRQGPAK